jgi:hypothetical protein
VLYATLHAVATPPWGGVTPALGAKGVAQMSIEDIYKIAGLLGAAIAWLHQIRTRSRREKIKLDLEILEKSRSLFGRESKNALLVEKAIEHRVNFVYGDASEGGSRRELPWVDLVLFLICALGTYGFASDGADAKIWQLVVAGVLGFMSIGALGNAIENWRGAGRA